MLTIRAMSNGEGYAAKHLAHSDYYAEGETVTGEWFGRASQLLGLSGEVEFKDFEAVREGLFFTRTPQCGSPRGRWFYDKPRPESL
jgi:hypothetical protein